MKKVVFAVLLLLTVTMVEGQKNSGKAVKPVSDSIVWNSKGNFSLLVNQSNYSNWASGGGNNLSGNVGVNYDLNYKKKDWSWDNKVLASYGLIRSQSSDFDKKTDDRFEFNSVLGKKAFGKWYYSMFLNFRTQFTNGYKYSKDINDTEIRIENSRFLSPGYLTFGPGMFWKKNDNLKINLAPVTSKLTFADSYFTSGANYVDRSYFGVDANKSVRYELGFYASVYYKLNLITNVSAENTLNLYSNYLMKPQNVDIDYSLAIVMRINRYLSTNISFQEVYDDNAFPGFQTREVFGLGINFSFANSEEPGD